jgi:HK97 family phage prohead protease
MPRKSFDGEADTEYKVAPLMTQQVADRSVTGIAAVMGNVDDGGDRLWAGAFNKTIQEQKSRIRHLWNHDMDQPPTAVIRDLREIGRAELPADLLSKFPDAKGGLQVARDYLPTPRADEILAGIRAGAINEMSFAFLPVRRDFEQSEGKSIRNLREVRLLETSDVPWGMNPASRAIKGALPFKEHPTAAIDAPWDGAVELAKAELADLKMMCAWTTDAETKDGYALAHHRADDGHSVVWRGVAAAMSALTSGKADVPPEARRAIFDHLAQHYEQFGQEPPDYKLVDFAYTVQDARRSYADAEEKIGRMISAQNMAKLKTAMTTLQEILLAAEPPSPEVMMEKAFTARQLFLEFEQAELDMERLVGVKHG